MRIALAQISSTPDPEANLAEVERRTREAADSGARLVLFPEATMCCFGVKLGPVAQPLDGPWATRVREVAAGAGVTVVAGMFTPSGDGRVRNTLLATGAGPRRTTTRSTCTTPSGSPSPTPWRPGRPR